jgi:hypothetical protein
MGRRMAPCVVQLESGGSHEGRSSNSLCLREFLQNKFDEAALETRPTTLDADTTIYHVDHIKGLFTESVHLLRNQLLNQSMSNKKLLPSQVLFRLRSRPM